MLQKIGNCYLKLVSPLFTHLTSLPVAPSCEKTSGISLFEKYQNGDAMFLA